MIVYYGIKRKIKIDKNLGNINCPNCGHFVEHALAHEGGYAHVYGIPIFPVLGGWKIKLCPNCGIIEKLSKDEFKRIKTCNPRNYMYPRLLLFKNIFI